MTATARSHASERAFRRTIVAERGKVPHHFVPGEKKHGIATCTQCGWYRPFFAHDADLIAEADELRTLAWDLLFGAGDALAVTKRMREIERS